MLGKGQVHPHLRQFRAAGLFCDAPIRVYQHKEKVSENNSHFSLYPNFTFIMQLMYRSCRPTSPPLFLRLRLQADVEQELISKSVNPSY